MISAPPSTTPPQNDPQPAPADKISGDRTLVLELIESLLDQPKLDRFTIDSAILDIDALLHAQINAILHAPQFQALECTWRTLKTMVERMDFRENTQLRILNTRKEELLEDFEDSYPVTNSALYRRVYTEEFGSHGGRPYALICANFDFGPNSDDLLLLRECAAVAAMAHTPFIANADPEFFGDDSVRAIPRIADLHSLLSTPQYNAWHKLRQNPDTRNVALCLPRFLLRLPYGEAGTVVNRFHFEEEAEGYHERFLWGPASALFACRVADSFAKYRWCPNITGVDSGGQVHDLLHYHYPTMGTLQARIPTEVQITDSKEYALSNAGFIPLTYRRRDQTACFYSASSIYMPNPSSDAGTKDDSTIDDHIAKQLPYLFIVTRLAHYIKVLQREHLGSWIDGPDIERHLNSWIRQYVADVDTPNPLVRARRPLRKAEIRVMELEDEPGWLRCHIQVQPHFKYMGAAFSLSLVGKLEQ